MDIAKCNAIITGGSSGLGLATAEKIINAGGTVTILDIQENIFKKNFKLYEKKCRFCSVDVTNQQSINEAIEIAIKNFGEISLLVNCAGVGVAKKILGREETHSTDDFNTVIQINLVGTFNMIRSCSEKMQNNQPNIDGSRGVIINTASIAAYDGQIGQAAYSASKAGIVGLTLPIARELSKFGIRVCTIAPGLFETPMMKGLPEKAINSLIESTLFPHRLGKPEEYAKLVLSVYENDMLNGETIRLDGSIRLTPR